MCAQRNARARITATEKLFATTSLAMHLAEQGASERTGVAARRGFSLKHCRAKCGVASRNSILAKLDEELSDAGLSVEYWGKAYFLWQERTSSFIANDGIVLNPEQAWIVCVFHERCVGQEQVRN